MASMHALYSPCSYKTALRLEAYLGSLESSWTAYTSSHVDSQNEVGVGTQSVSEKYYLLIAPSCSLKENIQD